MILSVRIDGDWTARDLAAVLEDIERLAEFTETGRIVKAGEFAFSGQTVAAVPGMPRPGRLKIVRLAYNSPGSIDLLGIAKIVEQIRLFLEFLINLFVLRNDRDFAREERAIELAAKRAEVLSQLVELHPHLVPFVEKEGADAMIEAVLTGRITAVETEQIDEKK